MKGDRAMTAPWKVSEMTLDQAQDELERMWSRGSLSTADLRRTTDLQRHIAMLERPRPIRIEEPARRMREQLTALRTGGR